MSLVNRKTYKLKNMTSITQHIQELHASLPEGVTLVAVSKFHPVEALQEAYDAGQRIFGESRAQELVAKAKVLPQDIEWHFIGPLQSNKVKDIAPFIHLIHSIDSLKLLQEVNKQAASCSRRGNQARVQRRGMPRIGATPAGTSPCAYLRNHGYGDTDR